jgi:translation initiation factor IF-2
MIILVSEMEELKTDISKKARGFIIESYLNPKKGPIATVIAQEGILEEGIIIATKSTMGKIKSMEDFEGNPIKTGLPAQPIMILGFEQSPIVGEEFESFDSAEEAKKQTAQSNNKKIFEGVKKEEGQKILNLILKADVSGSLEAIESVLKNIPQDKAIINILKAGVGEINDSDVKMAKASDSMVFGFRTKANQIAQKLALKERVRIMTFDIICELAQAIRTLLEKQLSPETVKENLGKIKVLAIFRTEKNRQIIGGKIIDGEARRGALIEAYRDEELLGKGKIIKLQKEKEEVDFLEKGRECGVLYQGDIELKEDDILEIYTEKKQKSTL